MAGLMVMTSCELDLQPVGLREWQARQGSVLTGFSFLSVYFKESGSGWTCGELRGFPMSNFRQQIVAAASMAALLVSLVACSSSDEGPEQDVQAATPDQELEDQASEGQDPEAEDLEPEGTPFETEPESVDVSVPESVDSAEPTEVEGRQLLPPVELDDAVTDAADGVTVWLERLTAVDEAGSRPGDIGGPAVQFDLLIHNDGPEPLDLATLVVAVAYGDDEIPAEDVLTEESRPLSGIVESGETLRGVVVFVVPPEERSDVTVTIDFEADAHIVVFQGEFPE